MNKKFDRHPYLFVSVLFLAMALFGIFASGWGEERFAFLLLLYLIVTIGIRIDEIVLLLEERSRAQAEMEGLRSEIVQLRHLVSSLAVRAGISPDVSAAIPPVESRDSGKEPLSPSG